MSYFKISFSIQLDGTVFPENEAGYWIVERELSQITVPSEAQD